MPKPYNGLVPSLAKNKPASIDIRPFTNLLTLFWPSDDQTHQLGTLDRSNKQFRNIPVSSIAKAEALAQDLSAKGLDAYFAMAEYSSPANRLAKNASGSRCFWLDIDCGEDKANKGKGYSTIERAKAALATFCADTGIPFPTNIVDSGGGLHVYWGLDGDIDRETWQKLARQLKEITVAHDLLADPTRTADIASVLRVPGTLNYKYDL